VGKKLLQMFPKYDKKTVCQCRHRWWNLGPLFWVRQKI
jgi:hypothetical protein